MNHDPHRCPIQLPDLGIPTDQLTVGLWLVALGARVCEGDRLVEIVAGDVCIDLSAPASGRLSKKLAAEDSPITPGQVLGWIRPDD